MCFLFIVNSCRQIPGQLEIPMWVDLSVSYKTHNIFRRHVYIAYGMLRPTRSIPIDQ